MTKLTQPESNETLDPPTYFTCKISLSNGAKSIWAGSKLGIFSNCSSVIILMQYPSHTLPVRPTRERVNKN